MPIPSHLPSRQQAIDVMNKSVRKDGKKLCNKDFTQFFSISENCVRDFKNTEKTVHDSTWWHIGESLWRLPTEQKPEGTPITKEEREQYKKVLRERKKELREEKKDDKKDEKKDEKKDDKDEKEKGKDEEKKEDKKDEKKDDKVEDKVEDKKDEKKDDKKDDKDEKEKGKDEEKKEDKKKSKEDEKKEKVQDKVDSMRDDKKDDPKKGYDNVHDISGLMEYNEKRGRREIIRKKQPKKEDPDSEDSSRKSEVKSEKKSGEKEKEEDKEEKKVEKKGKKEDKDEKDKEKTKKEKVKEKTKETKKKLIAKVKCWMFKARWRKAQYGALSVIKLKNKIAYRTQKIKKIQALTRGYLVRKRFQKRLEVFRNVLALLEISREMNEIIGRLNETSQNKWRQPAEATTRDLENLVVKIKHFDSPDRVEEARKSYDNYVKRVDSMIADLRNQLENEELTEVERRRKEDEEKEKRKMEIKALKELLIHREREEERERAQKEYEAQLEVQRLQEAAEKEEERKRQEKEERDRLDAMVSSRLNTSDGVALVAEKPEPVAAPAAKNKYDLGNLKHADLRDAINTSNDVEMLKACKEEEEARPGQLTVKVSTERKRQEKEEIEREKLIHREREEERERAQKEYEAQIEAQRLQEAAEKEEERKRQEKEERDRLDAMVSSRLNTSDGVALVAEKPEPVAAPAAKNKYDLGNLKHADLRDAINTSNDVEMLKACKEEEEARPGQLTVKVSTEAHSKSMPFQREVSPVKKKGPETWPPGDIHTVPTAKIVFNAPYDDKQTYHIKVINSTERRIVYALKTTNLRRFGVDPPCGVLDPKEAVLLAVSCDAFAYGQEDTNNDRISIEWTNTPDGAAKQFSREVFLNGTSKRKNWSIEYNI